MKRDRTYEELISAYIDGELEADQMRDVEETILSKPEWKKRYEEMRTLRSRMLSLPAEKQTKSLWPSLFRRLSDDKEKAAGITIIPDKLVPVVTVLLIIVVGLGSFYITRNWEAVTAYFDDTRAVVEDIYEQGIVRGALQPLFEGVTNDDLIRFAMSGILAIPEAEGQGLKVESDGDQQYEIEFADAQDARDAPSLSELYTTLEVTPGQINAIDSILTEYKDIVRSSAFIAGDDEVVISPELAGLDKFIIAAVAEQLQPAQRIRLNTVLNRFNPEIQIPEIGHFPHLVAARVKPDAPYQLQVSPAPNGRVEISAEFQKPETTEKVVDTRTQTRTFLVVRPDTVLSREIQIPDISYITEKLADAEKIRRKADEALAKRLQNTRIQFNTQHDSPHIQVFTHRDRPEVAGQVIKLDTMVIPHFPEEHFKQLHELSKMMQKRSEMFRPPLPAFMGGDTLDIEQGLKEFEDIFEKNMRQIEFDLNRLMEELEKVLEDPEHLMFSPDSVYFHLFPDTLE